MSIVVVVTAFPIPEDRADVIAAFEAAIARVHDEPGVELYALHEGRNRLVMIEKYESAEARSKHSQGAALADLRSALAGSSAPVSTCRFSNRTQPETRRRAHCDRPGRTSDGSPPERPQRWHNERPRPLDRR